MNVTINKNEIKAMIDEVRGAQVILASDLAQLFQTEAKKINQAVKRNNNIFEFGSYFRLTKEEYDNLSLISQKASLRSQIVTLNEKENGRGNHIKYLPFVFTRDGIETLATILKSKIVKEITKIILEVFDELNNNQIVLKSPEIQGKSLIPMIYEIRGKQVMLDSDLAQIYGCINGTKTINLAVKRNPERFPERYYFQLTEEEFSILRFQIETANNKSRNLPYAFTEEGVAMLSSVLRTPNAAQISIQIMDAFVTMHHFLINNQNVYQELGYHSRKLIEHDEKINQLFSKFETQEPKEYIYFNGQIYDSYSKIIDILKETQKELVIIDNYADKTILDIISKIKVNTILIVKSKSLLSKLDVEKYNKQYNNLKIIYDDTFHDRYIIIDKKIVYHLGASINHAGSKTFSINLLNDESIINIFIEYALKTGRNKLNERDN